MLEIKSLSKEYKRGHATVFALQNVSLSISDGAFISFIGKSGSGKSTLLNIIGGLDRPTRGEIHYRQETLSSLNASHF